MRTYTRKSKGRTQADRNRFWRIRQLAADLDLDPLTVRNNLKRGMPLSASAARFWRDLHGSAHMPNTFKEYDGKSIATARSKARAHGTDRLIYVIFATREDIEDELDRLPSYHHFRRTGSL